MGRSMKSGPKISEVWKPEKSLEDSSYLTLDSHSHCRVHQGRLRISSLPTCRRTPNSRAVRHQDVEILHADCIQPVRAWWRAWHVRSQTR